MGWSESKKEMLEAKNFDKLFLHKKHRAKWVAAAQNAQNYARVNITHGQEPRPDDTAEALLPILNADTDLLKHQRENHATSKKYREAFADLIVDQVLIEPTRRRQANGTGTGQQANDGGHENS
ncbi:MAG: hypothetical protein DMG72_22245 [Acidobacteria bacterium]|nr:MAG: hypothetical protein DMG72_22245 [Acidobacteriota bacterium]